MTRVVFLVAILRTRFDDEGNVVLNGMLGLWAFVEEVPSKRSSKNRLKGTLDRNPVNKDRTQYIRMLLENIITTITA